jgi:hypothetical protein
MLLSTSAFAATSNPYVPTYTDLEAARWVLVGCRLGTGFETGSSEAIPQRLAMSFNQNYPLTKLDKTVKLYVEWLMDTSVSLTPQHFDPPVAIDDEQFAEWFGDGSEFSVSNIFQTLDGRYKTCPSGSGLAAPTEMSNPINAEGEITFQDRFGGVGDDTIVEMMTPFAQGEIAHIYVGWDRPKTYFDDAEGTSDDQLPGTIYNRLLDYGEGLTTYIPVHIVEWVSADIADIDGSSTEPSPRDVDASDVSMVSQYSTGPVRWGFESEDPPESPTWEVDFNPIGSPGEYDQSEVNWMAYLLGSSCSSGKPTEDGNLYSRAVMEWFGFRLTGRTVTLLDGILGPEWEFVDEAQRARAIADPEGFRQNLATAVRDVSWSATKQLYR